MSEPSNAVPPALESATRLAGSPRAQRAYADMLVSIEQGDELAVIGERIIMELEQEAHEMLMANPPTKPIACKVGCAWCCHQGVDITVPEAALIAHHLEVNFPPAVKAVVVQRIRDTAKATAQMTPLDRQRSAIPCAFLGNDNSCIIHEVRPLLCRATMAPDAEQCRRAFVGGEIGTEETLPQPRAIAAAIVLGTAEGFRVASGGQGVYEMHALMAAVYRRTGG